MKKILTLAMLMVLSLISKAQTNSDLLQQARKTIEASNAIYADLANKNDGSILTRYTEDACLLPPNSGPICGKENIAKFFKDGPKVHVKFTIQHLYGDARTFITEESFYEMTDLDGNKLDEGKVIVIWKNTAVGLKMHRDMFSSNKPVAK
ncbi:YybH family protein [Chitinophaga ginsengisoli]|uniref:Ketosteroid isomerase-like protein n=1 Tax=Chitinophaga ginsengisoli TaxID=363837 RepID=A0A2P8G508_9BACT|nr:ketosteroid isomerase family protein [Chitinophaga ginsengisoli]PSL29047.1 ketosteroid isomerase-like protein [Chitinophaga ginsengisoli]